MAAKPTLGSWGGSPMDVAVVMAVRGSTDVHAQQDFGK